MNELSSRSNSSFAECFTAKSSCLNEHVHGGEGLRDVNAPKRLICKAVYMSV